MPSQTGVELIAMEKPQNWPPRSKAPTIFIPQFPFVTGGWLPPKLSLHHIWPSKRKPPGKDSEVFVAGHLGTSQNSDCQPGMGKAPTAALRSRFFLSWVLTAGLSNIEGSVDKFHNRICLYR